MNWYAEKDDEGGWLIYFVDEQDYTWPECFVEPDGQVWSFPF